MPSTLPAEDFSMNYERIEIKYSKPAPARTDSFEFKDWSDPTPPGSVPQPTQAAGDGTIVKPDLSDEMPEDLPAGLVVYVDYDLGF